MHTRTHAHTYTHLHTHTLTLLLVLGVLGVPEESLPPAPLWESLDAPAVEGVPGGRNWVVNALLRHMRVSMTCWQTRWAACGCMLTLPAPAAEAPAAERLYELCVTWNTLALHPSAASIPKDSHADWLGCLLVDGVLYNQRYQFKVPCCVNRHFLGFVGYRTSNSDSSN